jgi:Flp pilus assembly protein TadD
VLPLLVCFGQIDPHCAPVHCNIGNVYLRKHTQDGDQAHLLRAVDACQRALQIDGKAFHAMVFLGEALLRMGREVDGLKHLYDALRLAPTFPGAHSVLGAHFAAAGRIEEASV